MSARKPLKAPSAAIRSGRQYRGVSEAERLRERHARLLEAGYRIFGDQGYQHSTVKSVCAAAGLTERYFYESFANRDDLFRAVYEAQIERLRDTVVAAIMAQQGPEDMTREGLRAYFSALQQDPLLARIVLMEVTRVGGDMDAVWRASVEQFTQLLRGFAPRFLIGPDGPAYDLELLSAGLVGIALHVAMLWNLGGYRQPLETVVGHCFLQFNAVRKALQETDAPRES